MDVRISVPQRGSRHFFAYNTGLQTFAAIGGVLLGQITLQNDADFTLCYLGGNTSEQYTFPGGQTNLGNVGFRCLVKITDGGSNRVLVDVATPGEALVSTPNQLFELPARYTFPRGGSIMWEMTNNSGTAALTARLAFVGYKEY